MSEEKQPTIFCDTTIAGEYLGLLQGINCECMALPLKGAHFLIPPDLGIYRWDADLPPKDVVRQLNEFRAKYPNRLLIMEGSPDTDNALLFCGLQMRLWLDHADPMQPARDAIETCMILKSLATRLQIRDHPPALTRPKPADDLQSRPINLLEGLIGTGDKKAELLVDHFGSAWAVIEALDTNPKAILEVKGFGPEFVGTNQRLLNESM
jgi:ERCC4-type nuclease